MAARTTDFYHGFLGAWGTQCCGDVATPPATASGLFCTLWHGPATRPALRHALRDMVRTELSESQCPGVEPSHSSVARLYTRRHREPWVQRPVMVRLARWTMLSESIEGLEWVTEVALDTLLRCGTWEGRQVERLAVPAFS